MMNTTETTGNTITSEELAKIFEGKFVTIGSIDRYGVSITMLKASIEYEEEDRTLWLVARNEKDWIITSICFDEYTIESIINDGDGSYTINFTLDMESIDISECKL
ncbi:hypothetical protein AALC75_21010 [Lachnospiraceae bacterium 48-42]